LADANPDTSQPVRPGEPEVRAFWNTHALRFIYAPAFDLPAVKGAASYRFAIRSHDELTHTFDAPKPWAALTPVWNEVGEGYTKLTVDGLDAAGNKIGTSGERVFYRSPGFSEQIDSAPAAYHDAGRSALRAIFEAPHVQYWLKDAKPDPSYARYCYPNKVIGAVVRAMTAYSIAAESEKDRASALEIARRAADYLLSLRLPANSPYANVPPTYALDVASPTRVTLPRVKDHWLMVPSVIDSSLGFLDLYDATHDAKYLDAAKAIADTFVKTQESDGTWPLMANDQTGKAIENQRLVPTWVIFFFDRLDRQYHLPAYQAARARAWSWIVEHPLKNYQWDAQFEDVKPREPYVNLAREQACDVANLLLSNPQRTSDEIAQAEELLRFAEDQFVVWTPVQDVAGWKKAMPNRRKNCEVWMTPCVLEQYVCYDPVASESSRSHAQAGVSREGAGAGQRYARRPGVARERIRRQRRNPDVEHEAQADQLAK